MQSTSAASDSSTFDPSSLLDTEYSDDLNTRFTPVPEGAWYARIGKPRSGCGIDVRKITVQGRETRVADFTFIVDDPKVQESTKMDEPTARMSIFLDTNPDGTIITKEQNPNANVKLGRLKEALGFKAGKKWSLRQMDGMSCFIKVKHRTDSNDIENVFADVVAVSKEQFKN